MDDFPYEELISFATPAAEIVDSSEGSPKSRKKHSKR
jgi:hypothetical protein